MAFSSLFIYGNSIRLVWRRSSSILDISKSRKVYSFPCLSFRKGRFLPLSFEFTGFPSCFLEVLVEILTAKELTNVDYLPSAFMAILPLFWVSCFSLPFFGSCTSKVSFPVKTMLSFISCAHIAYSLKVFGLMPYKMYCNLYFIPLIYMSSVEDSDRWSL